MKDFRLYKEANQFDNNNHNTINDREDNRYINKVERYDDRYKIKMHRQW